METWLLPFKYKIAGVILFFTGLAIGVVYVFSGLNITLPVFAIASVFFSNAFFTCITTNVADEIALVTMLAGLSLWVFTKERIEKAYYNDIRILSLVRSILANLMFLFFSVIFVYGTAFVIVLVFNMYSTFLFYLLFFTILKQSYKRKL